MCQHLHTVEDTRIISRGSVYDESGPDYDDSVTICLDCGARNVHAPVEELETIDIPF